MSSKHWQNVLMRWEKISQSHCCISSYKLLIHHLSKTVALIESWLAEISQNFDHASTGKYGWTWTDLNWIGSYGTFIIKLYFIILWNLHPLMEVDNFL